MNKTALSTGSTPLVLASASASRQAMLAAAGVAALAVPARLDESAIIASLGAAGHGPRAIADALAEAKALRVAARHPGAAVIGADQVLDLDGTVIDKTADIDAVRTQLQRLHGRTHVLHTAVVVVHQARPVWRHIEEARLTMRAASDAYLGAYLARHGAGLVGTAGGYRIEDEGLRLFARIEGDWSGILGLPMLPLLNYLAQRGWIDG